MRFYSRKKPQKKTDLLIERISTGKCDDLVVSELKVAASELTEPADMEQAITGLMDIVTKSGNSISIAYAIKSLLALRPLTAGLEDDLENRVRELVADKAVMATRQLQEAIAELLYIRVSERAERAQPFMGALVVFLDERMGKGGNIAYNTLMIVAANKPELFEGQTSPLIRMLGSINNVTRIETCKIIAVLAMSHPEYLESAEKALLDISSFNPDGDVKNAASEAHQILSGRLKSVEKTVVPDDSARRNQYEQQQAGGLAEIMRRKAGKDVRQTGENRVDKRLLSLASSFARKGDRAYKIVGESPAEYEENETQAISQIMDDFSEIAESIKAEAKPVEAPVAEAAPANETDTAEEAELRRMMEKVQDDFSITAGSILDAIGMGHLAKPHGVEEAKPRSADSSLLDRTRRVRTARPDLSMVRVPEKTPVKNDVEEEPEVNPKEFIASIESIINATDNMQPGQPATPETPVAPAVPLKAEADFVAAPTEIPAASPAPVKEVLPPAATVGKTQADSPVEIAKPEKPAPVERADEMEKRPRPAIVPPSVRISAMKFKTVDHSKPKKPAPAKISIKPHIKPLSKPPVDALKNVAPRQQPVGGAPEIMTDGTGSYVICHSCNAKMPDDSQRCAICGSDLKEPKVRCRNCGEIIPRQSGNCTRCGASLDE